MAPIEYSPNEKGIMTPMEYTPWFIAPKEKVWFYERLFFEVVNVIVKDEKIQCKRCNVYKN